MVLVDDKTWLLSKTERIKLRQTELVEVCRSLSKFDSTIPLLNTND